ncbi:hypothetical protein HGB13_03940 [bacterium]|nr:hypothetical protein [bacterium]
MALFNAINNIWQSFLGIFPPEYHGFVASGVLLLLIISFVFMFMFNPFVFIIVLIIFTPIIYPILTTFLNEVAELIKHLTGPSPPKI